MVETFKFFKESELLIMEKYAKSSAPLREIAKLSGRSISGVYLMFKKHGGRKNFTAEKELQRRLLVSREKRKKVSDSIKKNKHLRVQYSHITLDDLFLLEEGIKKNPNGLLKQIGAKVNKCNASKYRNIRKIKAHNNSVFDMFYADFKKGPKAVTRGDSMKIFHKRHLKFINKHFDFLLEQLKRLQKQAGL